MEKLVTFFDKSRELREEAAKRPWKAFENGPWGGQGYGVAIGDDIEEWLTTKKLAQNGSNALYVVHCVNTHEKLCELLESALNTLLSVQSNRGTHAGSINAKNFHECREACLKIQSELEKLL